MECTSPDWNPNCVNHSGGVATTPTSGSPPGFGGAEDCVHQRLADAVAPVMGIHGRRHQGHDGCGIDLAPAGGDVTYDFWSSPRATRDIPGILASSACTWSKKPSE